MNDTLLHSFKKKTSIASSQYGWMDRGDWMNVCLKTNSIWYSGMMIVMCKQGSSTMIFEYR
jgi:hypothetical protein